MNAINDLNTLSSSNRNINSYNITEIFNVQLRRPETATVSQREKWRAAAAELSLCVCSTAPWQMQLSLQ